MKKWGLVLIVLIFSFGIVEKTQAQELPDFVVKAVAEVSVYSDEPYSEDNKIKQGSGVFVDHGGCLYTNSHVVLDLASDEIEPYIVVRITDDRAKPAKFLFEGEVTFVDQATDLAYVCPKWGQDIFTHFFERKKQSQFEILPFGYEVWVMGYPAAGEGTITIAPGNIVGFIDGPDIDGWLGVPDLDADLLKLYKTDALAGLGVSGGLLVGHDLELVGVPFAGTINPGAFTFVLSDAVYLEFENRLRAYLHKNNLVPSDCVYNFKDEYYHQAGQLFYDNQCEYIYDETMEHEVKRTYQSFCQKDISEQRLVQAVKRGKEIGDLGAWSDNLILMCPKVETINNDVDINAGDFAYGKARLNDLEKEQALAKELKYIIDAKYPNIKIHADNWSTIVNSYIYGGYPVEAIMRAIKLGGYTVHPTIPYEVWKGSVDYLKYFS